MDSITVKDQITVLGRLLEMANSKTKDKHDEPFGRCDWTDVEGNARCNSPWSQFQCEQAGGTFTPDGKCDDDKKKW